MVFRAREKPSFPLNSRSLLSFVDLISDRIVDIGLYSKARNRK
jgi:hypothetical protein